MADNYGGKGRRRGGKGQKDGGSQDYDAYASESMKGMSGKGGAGMGGGKGNASAGKSLKDTAEVHHFPPKEMAADVGYPVRGGQTLLIAYFPWEASEADIEREFCKISRVKRVHLVVDKSSRKPRCFGFVKFLSKADAEEALRATTQGQVQLPDTRGHVWHLKAEWTKSGDMVVDDSEAEQEVAKRKEERRTRIDTRGPITGINEVMPPRGIMGGKGAPPPPKGALHPGVPAPLPPLQTRYPPQASLGLPPPPASMQHQHQSMAQAHSQALLSQQPMAQQLYGAPGSMQQMYGGQQHLYGNQAAVQSALYGGLTGGVPVGPAMGRDGGNAGAIGAIGPHSQGVGGLDAPGLAGISSGAAPPPLLRDLQGYAAAAAAGQQGYGAASNYAAAVAAAAAQQAGGYPAQAQSYGGQQGYPTSQPYVSSQQAYAGAGHYAGQQAYAAGQQAYQTAAATASGPQPPSYAQQLQGYPPQAQAGGYGAPPGCGYGAQAYSQASSYPTSSTAYATAGFGLGQGAYSHLYQQQQAAQQPSGVVAYGSYPGALQQAALQQQILPQDPSVGVAAMPSHSLAAHQGIVQQVQPQQYSQAQAIALPMVDTSVATASLAASGPAPDLQQQQQQYLDMVWQMSDMSLQAQEKQPLPAPPAQQPPAPPAGHVPSVQWQRDGIASSAVPAGVSKEWENAPRPSGGAGAAVWNSFDDAAAKGMVDGLVGDDTTAPPSLPPPPPGSTGVWGSH